MEEEKKKGPATFQKTAERNFLIQDSIFLDRVTEPFAAFEPHQQPLCICIIC